MVHDSRFMILGRAKRKVNGQIQLDMIDFKKNHVYVGKSDRAQEWAGPDCADSDKPTAKIYVVVKYKP